MLSTFVVAAILIGLLLATFLLQSLLLWLGARVCKVEGATWRRALWAVLSMTLIYGVIALLVGFLPDHRPGKLLGGALALLAACVAPVIVISRVLGVRWGKALLLWLLTLVAKPIVVFLLAWPIRSFAIEAFVMPGNSMAPTLLGPHWEGKCQVCGGPAFCTPRLDGNAPKTQPMICRDHFHESLVDDFDLTMHPPDRIIVSKFLTPRRWDLLVFRDPADGKTPYVMRMVGLPGENVTIRDGAVWIDGAKLEPPKHLRELRYVSEMEGYPWALTGTVDVPAQLGADEYFVLGDFSSHSRDSRLWEQGAAGHPAYAVPTDHVIGVVTQTYWPPSRWRAFR